MKSLRKIISGTSIIVGLISIIYGLIIHQTFFDNWILCGIIVFILGIVVLITKEIDEIEERLNKLENPRL